MIKALVFAIFLPILSCAKISPHLEKAHNIQNVFLEYMKCQHFRPRAMGGGLFKDIEEFNFEYEITVDSVNINEAREYIVICTEKLLEITNNKGAIPYLRHYPYDQKHLFFGITFKNKSGTIFDNGQLTRVVVGYDDVIFNSYGKTYVDLLREPYAEAYEKVYGGPLPDRKKQFGVEVL